MRIFSAALLVAAAGCAATDYEKTRTDHAESFASDLQETTKTVLSERGPLKLADCIEIALSENLDLETKRIEQRLAGLDRTIVFGEFLPHVQVELSYRGTTDRQLVGSNGTYVQFSDREVAEATVRGYQPIFLPQAWFIFDALSRGTEIADLVAERARQLITLRVTALYFACLSLDRSHPSLHHAVVETEALANEIGHLAEEGLVLPAQVLEAEAILRSRRNDLAENERARRETRAQLLEVMGLSPLASVELSEETPLSAPAAGLPELVFTALRNRLELYGADRTIEIREDEVLTAIAAFLPTIMGFGGYAHTSDSFLKYANIWSYGISGVLTVFDGFKNIGEYKAARQREEAARVERERLCLSVMLEVIRAHLQVEAAADGLQLARAAARAQDLNLEEIRARWQEGLIRTPEYLKAVTRREKAEAAVAQAVFRHQVAAATLRDVVGQSAVPWPGTADRTRGSQSTES